MFRIVKYVVLFILFALFAYDYYQVRTDAFCAHASIVNHGGGQ